MPITKIELAESLFINIGIPKKDCLNVVDCLLDIIKDELSSGEKVNISGFGKWTVRSKRPRKGRNPQTGETITIPPKRVLTFHPSAKLRQAVNAEKLK